MNELTIKKDGIKTVLKSRAVGTCSPSGDNDLVILSSSHLKHSYNSCKNDTL